MMKTRSRWWVSGGSFVVGAAVICLALMNGIARHAVDSDDSALATAVRPDWSQSIRLAAQSKLDSDPNGAMRLITRALKRNPLDVASLRVAGFAAQRLGQAEEAMALMSFAGRRSWRDTPTQAWLFQQAALHGDFTAMAQHGDALLRRDRMTNIVYQTFVASAAAPAALQPLADRLSADPPWEGAFLERLAKADPAFIPSQPAMLGLISPAPQQYLMAGYFATLVDRGFAPQAQELADRLYPKGKTGLVRDGNFENTNLSDATGDQVLPFDWWINLSSGAGVSIGAAPGGGNGNALIVDATPDQAGVIASQTLSLAPGRYRVSTTLWAKQSDDSERAVLRVICLPSLEAVAETPMRRIAAQSSQKMEMTIDFAKKPGCSAARVALALAEGPTASSVSYSDVSVLRETGASPPGSPAATLP